MDSLSVFVEGEISFNGELTAYFAESFLLPEEVKKDIRTDIIQHLADYDYSIMMEDIEEILSDHLSDIPNLQKTLGFKTDLDLCVIDLSFSFDDYTTEEVLGLLNIKFE